jgi:hypothetical protein
VLSCQWWQTIGVVTGSPATRFMYMGNSDMAVQYIKQQSQLSSGSFAA